MDKIVRAMAYDRKVRVFATLSTQTVKDAIDNHKLNLASAMALGRLLSATAMMSLMGDEGLLAVQVLSKGPMKGLIAISDKRGRVKGYVFNNDYTSYGQDVSSIGQLIMPGQLVVSKDMGLKEPYTGIIDLASGEIAEDIAKYYTDSEQTPSACALGTYFDQEGNLLAAGGYIVQVMPGTDEKILKELEQRVDLSTNISELLYDLGSAEKILEFLFSDRALEITDSVDLSFSCDCSYKGILEKLLVLDKSQLMEIAQEEEVIEAVCPYCSSKYHYDAKEVLELLEERE